MTRVEELRREIVAAHYDYLMFDQMVEREFPRWTPAQVRVLARSREACRAHRDELVETLAELDPIVTDERHDPTVSHPTQS